MSKLKAVFASSYQPYFAEKIRLLREEEVKTMKAFYFLVSVTVGVMAAASPLALVVMFATARLDQTSSGVRQLDPAAIFSSVALLGLLDMPIIMLSQLIGRLFAGLAALQRLEHTLFADDPAECQGAAEQEGKQNAVEEQFRIEAKRLGAIIQARLEQAKSSSGTQVLHLVGPSSSGKTTLINHLLRHLLENSNLAVGFAPQGLAALFEDLSMRSNIKLWDRSVSEDSDKEETATIVPVEPEGLQRCSLDDALRFCCLHPDVAALEHGVSTHVADLSGGQRQRVALARTVYSRAPIIIMDNSLSALDAITQDNIEQNLFGISEPRAWTILKGRVVLWASSQESQYDRSDSVLRVSLDEGHLNVQESGHSPAITGADSTGPHGAETEKTDKELQSESQPADASSLLSIASNSSADSKEEEHSSHLGLKPYLFWFSNAPSRWLLIMFFFSWGDWGGNIFEQYVLQAWSARSLAAGGVLPQPGLWLSLLATVSAICVTIGTIFYFGWNTIVATRTSLSVNRKAVTALLATTPYNSLIPAQLKARFTQDISVIDNEFPGNCLMLLEFLRLAIAMVTIIIAVPFMAFCLPIVVAEFWIVQRGFLVSVGLLKYPA